MKNFKQWKSEYLGFLIIKQALWRCDNVEHIDMLASTWGPKMTKGTYQLLESTLSNYLW